MGRAAAADAAPARRRKSAAERRAQRLRAETRFVECFLKGVANLRAHRGSQPSQLGEALALLLAPASVLPGPVRGAPASAPRRFVGAAGSSSHRCAPVSAPVAGDGGAQGDRLEEMHVDTDSVAAVAPPDGPLDAPAAPSAPVEVAREWIALARARVRALPSECAGTVGFLSAGQAVVGTMVISGGRQWVQVVHASELDTPGFVFVQYTDGEVVLRSVVVENDDG